MQDKRSAEDNRHRENESYVEKEMIMQNYRFLIAYDGTRYHGWEHKKDVVTIQGKIESVLSLMAGEEVRINGAGRTDAGVHARAMVASGPVPTDKTPEEIRDYMNHYLPDDICILEVTPAAERFHARFNAKGKHYRYTIYRGRLKPVFDRKYVWTLDEGETIDCERMRKAAAYLVGEHDFKSFCGNKQMKKSTVRKLFAIDIKEASDYVILDFHGAGFLQNMVRILTGTLVEVGAGRMEPAYMEEVLTGRCRQLAGPTAPPQGLCLMQVDYEKK